MAFFIRTRGKDRLKYRFGKDKKYWFKEIIGLARKRNKKEIKKSGLRGK